MKLRSWKAIDMTGEGAHSMKQNGGKPLELSMLEGRLVAEEEKGD